MLANDDGITVIDITDPLDPAYCHTLDSTALDAATYVRSYYETDSDDSPVEMDIRCHIAALEKERLVSDEALYEVWPKVFKSYGQEKSSLVQSGEASVASPLPPLADLALRQIVDQCIAEDDFEPLETLTDMPGKMESVAAALFLKKALPDSAQGVLSGVLQFELEGTEA
ncbi:hypothetical protein VNI00_014276 [Paramarasmius palmivorus]|uniref:Uncharacterized protein n=1 Tax=Paramarasmius palmivorus TaxID=297713 RepID=A0AAW0BUJ6_9AGAR